jgi:hypothetical protein
MVEVIWEFLVADAHRTEFESLYNSDGVWAQLFRNHPAYHGTTLLCDRDDRGRYLTIDRWQSLDSYNSFKQRFAPEYAAIDEQCEALTSSERLIGIFDRV